MQAIDIISKLTPVVINVIVLIILLAMKYNDVNHLQKSIDELKDKINDLQKQVIEHEKRLSRIEGKLNGNK